MAVVANLTALARACGPIVAGSVTSSSEVRKRMMAPARFRLFARGLERFAPLAERSGYLIAESRTAVVSEQVLLRPRATLAMTSPRCGSRANSIKLGSVHRSSPRPKSGLPDLRFRVRCLLRVDSVEKLDCCSGKGSLIQSC